MNDISYQKILFQLEQGKIEDDFAENAMTLYEKVQTMETAEKIEIAENIRKTLHKKLEQNIEIVTLIYSYLLQIYPNPQYMEKFLRILMQEGQLSWQNCYYLFGQLNHFLFQHSVCNNITVQGLLWQFLEQIQEECRKQMKFSYPFIRPEEREENLAIVLIEQYLDEKHGPIKTALDRCYILQHTLGKKVLLINTAELAASSGEVSYFAPSYAQYRPELTEESSVEWKGEKIAYIQCKNNMPDIPTMEQLLKMILDKKPGMVLNVGGTSLFAGIVNEWIPVLTIGTLLSMPALTLAKYQMIDRKQMFAHKPLFALVNKEWEHVIPGKFTYSLKTQTEKHTRKELGIPEKQFVIAVVGSRLTEEITKEFWYLCEQAVSHYADVHIVFIGVHKNFEEAVSGYPKLQGRVSYLGVCEDILSYIELCDLYINPHRRGGGGSAVEAMYKGKPVITTKYGDVYAVVDEKFSCNDYREMLIRIGTYVTNSAYYQEHSLHARKLAEKNMDSEREFVRILQEYQKRTKEKPEKKEELVFPEDYFDNNYVKVKYQDQVSREDYTVEPMQKRIWAGLLKILQEIDRICTKHGIAYFADRGTLLGAVRCQGFLPWDDDLDIAMLRADYEKFKQIAKTELGAEYRLEMRSDDTYPLEVGVANAWIEEGKMEEEEETITERMENFYGCPFPLKVDIHILDDIPKDKEEQKENHALLADIYWLLQKIKDNDWVVTPDMEQEFSVICQRSDADIPNEGTILWKLKELADKVARTCKGAVSSKVANRLFHTNTVVEPVFLEKSWYAESERIPFEHITIPVPIYTGAVLKQHLILMDTELRKSSTSPGHFYGDVNFWKRHEKGNIAKIIREDKLCEVTPDAKGLTFPANFFEAECREMSYTEWIQCESFELDPMMKRVWAASIKVLMEIDRICTKHGISYFAHAGTLLGAGRHQGFIPWDDDIDIAMKREDYKRFVGIAREELGMDYCVVDAVYDKDWANPMARVLNISDLKYSQIGYVPSRLKKFYGCPYAVGIDIAPLDYIPRDKEAEQVQREVLAILVTMATEILENDNYITPEMGITLAKVEEICNYHFNNESSILNQVQRLVGVISQLYGKEDGDEITYMPSYIKRPTFRFQAEWYADTVRLPFENVKIMVPKDYEKVLEHQYGKIWKTYCIKGASAHDYPFYKKQQKEFEERGIRF